MISLGYRTDLMLLALEGSEITDRGDHLVIRSPANPSFWWGNFLLLATPPPRGETGRWLSRFAAEFPDADRIALGVDTTEAHAIDPAELVTAGMRFQRDTVMATSAIHDPPHLNTMATCRQLASDDDWRQATALRAACYPDSERGGGAAFIAARMAAERRLTEAGHGSWFGAFQDGQLMAQLGLFCGDGGIARYQNVETHPAARR